MYFKLDFIQVNSNLKLIMSLFLRLEDFKLIRLLIEMRLFLTTPVNLSLSFWSSSSINTFIF